MKTLPIIIVCFCLVFTSKAQKIRFTDTTNVWEELHPEYNAPDPWILNYSTYHYLTDTTLSGHAYRIFTFGIVREDTVTGKVFLWDEFGDTDRLLMNYNLTTGDTFRTAYYNYTVARVDSTKMFSHWYRVWIFSPLVSGGIYGNDSLCFIEGVGCIQDPTYMLGNFSSCVECSQPSMFCFSHNGVNPNLNPKVQFLDDSTSCVTYPKLASQYLVISGNTLSVFPNPSSGMVHISGAMPLGELTVRNAIGKTVYTIQASEKGVAELNSAQLLTGVYFIVDNRSHYSRFQIL